MTKSISAKKTFSMIWEFIGCVAGLLLCFVPDGKSLIEVIVSNLRIDTPSIYGFKAELLIMIAVFLGVYFTSHRFFKKETNTKMYSVIVSGIMILTLVTALAFRN